jgi:hypothetical protein
LANSCGFLHGHVTQYMRESTALDNVGKPLQNLF